MSALRPPDKKPRVIDGQTTVLAVPGVSWGGKLELELNVREDFTITENAPTG